MACATISLKRAHEFEPLSQRRPKRRRCTPLKLTTLTNTPTPTKPPSVFQEATPHLNKEQLAASIRSEIKRLRHRKKLAVHSSSSHSDSSDGEQPSTSSSSSSVDASHGHSSSSQQKKDNTPLFTFQQMTILCQKMVKDRTELLREEYDQVLASKLAEQYEAFLKFNHDQVQRHFSNSSDASYLS